MDSKNLEAVADRVDKVIAFNSIEWIQGDPNPARDRLFPFNSIEWIRGGAFLYPLVVLASLSIPLNGFSTNCSSSASGRTRRAFNSIEWIQKC